MVTYRIMESSVLLVLLSLKYLARVVLLKSIRQCQCVPLNLQQKMHFVDKGDLTDSAGFDDVPDTIHI